MWKIKQRLYLLQDFKNLLDKYNAKIVIDDGSVFIIIINGNVVFIINKKITSEILGESIQFKIDNSNESKSCIYFLQDFKNLLDKYQATCKYDIQYGFNIFFTYSDMELAINIFEHEINSNVLGVEITERLNDIEDVKNNE